MSALPIAGVLDTFSGAFDFMFQQRPSAQEGSDVLVGGPEQVLDLVASQAMISLIALAIALVIALPLGVLAAIRQGSGVDHLTRVCMLLLSSMPSFWLGYVLILAFAVWLQFLPVAGAGSPRHVALPALTLALGMAGGLSRVTRAGLLEELHQPYTRTASAKGIRAAAVVLRHAFRNAAITLGTVVMLRFGHLLGGAVVVETVFAWPGIGTLVVDAVYDRDYPVIQGFVLFTGTMFLLLNLAADLMHGWLDPRVHPQQAGRPA